MPEIKEKPKAGKPKGRRKSAGPPRQAGRLMKEKLVREVDQRKEREAENGSYAVDQVEQAGVQGADEFIQALRPNHKRKSGAGNTQSAKENRDGRPEREVPPQGQPTSAPKERRPVEGQRPQRQGTVPRERSPGGQQAVPIGSAPGWRQKSAGGARPSRDRRARMPCRRKHLPQRRGGSQPAGPGPPHIAGRAAPARGGGPVRVSGGQGRMFAALSWAGQPPRPEPQVRRDAPRPCREARRLWGPRSGEPRSLPGDLSKRSKNLPRPPGSPPSAAWPSRRPAPQREPPSWAGG